jgi:hypothetical protein
MKKILSLFALSLVLIAARTMSAADKPAAAQPVLDVSGTWDLTVQTDAGSGNPVFTFKQEGEKLTGTYKGVFGEASVTGSLKGSEIKFSFKASGQGQEMTISYEGTAEAAAMKGKVSLGELGQGTFTGKKQAK